MLIERNIIQVACSTGIPDFSVLFTKTEVDPYFNQCARIRALAKTSAKKEVGGEDRVWRSFAQQLKPSHAKCRKTRSHR